MFAEEALLAQTLVCGHRKVSSNRSNMRLRAYVSYTMRKTPANIPDERERFEAPRPNPSGGPPRWTRSSAKPSVDSKIDLPESVQAKVQAILDLAAADAVTAAVTAPVPFQASHGLCSRGDAPIKIVSHSS
ncbi:DUF6192 family protein [Streptomyces hokutonensis]|uniref:DUF6192 family protein n=1 Tax=Streptomyces hokutonensis TaxID=1306990 RepID=UPI0037FB58CA